MVFLTVLVALLWPPSAPAPAATVAPAEISAAGAPAPFITDIRPAIEATAAPVPLKLHGAPYVTDVTPTSAVVNWLVKVGPVTVGESPDQLSRSAHGWRVERAAMTGLKPLTTYYYDVLRDGSPEGKGQFTTAPNSPGEFTFAVYGDTRTRHDVHRQVAAKIAEKAPAFLVHTGDLVADGLKAEQWPVFFESSEKALRKSAFYPALGNHDRNSPFFFEFFPRRPSYYSFDWGAAHFALLNSNPEAGVSPEQFWAEQLAWLERDLARAASADFRFVVLHHTPYTAVKARQGAAEALAARLTPILRKYRVHAVFSGHDHNYQRHLVDGIQYIVTGGGGAPLYEVSAPMPGLTQAAEKVENFVLARVAGRECHLQAIAVDGRVLDSLVLTGGPPTAIVRPAAPPAVAAKP